MSSQDISAQRMAEMIAVFANEKKADNVVIMNMSRISSVCDFFVVSSASSNIRARTIAENIMQRMKGEGFRVLHREGLKEGKWVLLDFGEVITQFSGANEEVLRSKVSELTGTAAQAPTVQQVQPAPPSSTASPEL